MSVILGMHASDDFAADERPKDWREAILYMFPNGMVPFNALLAKARKEKTTDPQFNWWSKGETIRYSQINHVGGYSDAATEMVVDDASVFRADDLVTVVNDINSIDEVMMVSSVNTGTNTLTVSRNWAGDGAHAVSDNDYVLVIGNANEEGAGIREGLYTQPTKDYNYTQIFRTPLELTRTAQKTKAWTGERLNDAKREALYIHSCDMERAFLFSGRHEATGGGGKPKRTTGGVVRHFIHADNVVSCNSGGTAGNLDIGDWETYLQQMFRYGSQDKLAFCGNQALLVLNRMARKESEMSLQPNAKFFGMKLTQWVTPWGTLTLKSHPLFNEIPGHSRCILAIDMDNVVYRFLDDTDFLKDRQANDIDGQKSEFLTEAGLEVHHPRTHYLLKNVNAYAAEA
ncbi:MAG: DUF5309 family protein [Pseudomonadota bacterium]